MRAFRSVMVWLLAACWLPATLHCAIEQAGISAFQDQCCEADPGATGVAGGLGHCGSDGCDVLESSLIKQTGDLLKAPAPEWNAVLQFALAPPEYEDLAPAVSPATTDRPLELPRTWQFVARAAHTPRAPGTTS